VLALIPLLPLAGFVVNAFLGRRLPKSISGGIACAAMVAAFGVSLAAVFSMLQAGTGVLQTSYSWIASGDLHVGASLYLDRLSSVMILVITGIGSLIHIYSTAYMHEESDSEYARYFSYLNLFAAFMLVLVLGASLPVMFIGWEGVGLCSYLLIGFWYKKKSATDAANKAFIVNRVGDFAFILGTLLLFTQLHTVDFQEIALGVSQLPVEPGWGVLSVAALLLFIGATGKSAQIPLYVWLPDAMEGPTPVSALIHAATMVTAGVFMIGRNAVLFSHAPEAMQVVAVIGAATALFAGTIGLVQNDIKRVLAYSTVSQLGYMFLAMGVGAFTAGIFHLYTHAFFKALLFLGSGAVIHALNGQQDLREMGGLKRRLPITYWTFLIGALAIAGFPLLSGFFSKDEILYRTYTSGHTGLWLLALLTSLLTAIYMFRLVFLAFHGEPHPAPAAGAAHGAQDAGHHTAGDHATHVHDAPMAMAFALIILAVGSVGAGYINVPHAIGGSTELERFLEPNLGAGEHLTAATASSASGESQEASVGTERGLMALSSLVGLAGIGIAGFFFLQNKRAADRLAERMAGLRTLLENKYYVDEIYDAVIVQPIRILSEHGLWKIVDVRLIDGAVNGAGETVGWFSYVLRRLQTGSVRAYAVSLFLGVVLMLGYYLWP